MVSRPLPLNDEFFSFLVSDWNWVFYVLPTVSPYSFLHMANALFFSNQNFTIRSSVDDSHVLFWVAVQNVICDLSNIWTIAWTSIWPEYFSWLASDSFLLCLIPNPACFAIRTFHENVCRRFCHCNIQLEMKCCKRKWKLAFSMFHRSTRSSSKFWAFRQAST